MAKGILSKLFWLSIFCPSYFVTEPYQGCNSERNFHLWISPVEGCEDNDAHFMGSFYMHDREYSEMEKSETGRIELKWIP